MSKLLKIFQFSFTISNATDQNELRKLVYCVNRFCTFKSFLWLRSQKVTAPGW